MMRDSQLFTTRSFRTIYKQPGPTNITTSMILWLMLSQDIHTISEMQNKWQKNGSVLEKWTWTEPTYESMQMLQPR